ncbi:MAG: CoA ester lyase [Pseudohongiellaceae bacterium]
MSVSQEGHDAQEAIMKSLRRSLHFVPGGNEKMFIKATGLPADSLILDLEDAVTPENKADARKRVCEWLASTAWKGQEKLVRINPLESPWGREDIEAVMAVSPDGIVLPKIHDSAGVMAVDVLVTSLEREFARVHGSTPLLLIGTEEAAAVFNLNHTLNHARIEGVAWAAEDLSNALGAKAKRDDQGNYLEVFRYVRSLCLLAAIANGKQAIDGPFVDIRDRQGLEQECKLTSSMGYSGKLTIHPDQIDTVNRSFSPSDEEVSRARELVEAFASHQAEGRMAFAFNGEMVDVPHLKRAEALLARAALIKQYDNR